jgi:hypothetical protein
MSTPLAAFGGLDLVDLFENVGRQALDAVKIGHIEHIPYRPAQITRRPIVALTALTTASSVLAAKNARIVR